jgi:hypothetical protein
MFNDLNSNNQSVPPKPVDDIFADVDKTAEAKKTSAYYPGDSEIEANKVGVLTSPETEENSSKSKIIKIILICLLVVVLLSLGYLAYSKFFANKEAGQVEQLNTKPAVVETPVVVEEPVVPVAEVPVSEEVVITPSLPTPTTTPPISNLTDSDSDGLTDEEESVLSTNINLIDTDNDGLSDFEEVKTYNTNPLLADTDIDELSDYEELKIYKTNAQNPDTDGDTYLDGAEVKGGYDPTAVGKKLGE